jgi:hypothetical protein
VWKCGGVFVEGVQVEQEPSRNVLRRRGLIVEVLLESMQNEIEPARLDRADVAAILGFRQARPSEFGCFPTAEVVGPPPSNLYGLQPFSSPVPQVYQLCSDHSNQRHENRPVPGHRTQVNCCGDRCFTRVSSWSFMLKAALPERILIVDDGPEVASLARGARQKIGCMIVETPLFGASGGEFLSRSLTRDASLAVLVLRSRPDVRTRCTTSSTARSITSPSHSIHP